MTRRPHSLGASVPSWPLAAMHGYAVRTHRLSCCLLALRLMLPMPSPATFRTPAALQALADATAASFRVECTLLVLSGGEAYLLTQLREEAMRAVAATLPDDPTFRATVLADLSECADLDTLRPLVLAQRIAAATGVLPMLLASLSSAAQPRVA